MIEKCIYIEIKKLVQYLLLMNFSMRFKFYISSKGSFYANICGKRFKFDRKDFKQRMFKICF